MKFKPILSKIFFLITLVSLFSVSVYSTLTDNLQECFTFDNAYTSGATSIGSTGYRNGTISGATTGNQGKYGEAYCFNTNDYVNIGNMGLTRNGTIIFWENHTFSSTQWIWGTKEPAGADGGEECYIASGLYYCRLDNDGTASSGVSRNNGQWNFYAFTWEDDRDTFVYINGELNNSGAISDFGYDKDTQDFMIGELGRSLGGSGFIGCLDDFAVYNRTLLASEIQDIYQNSKSCPYGVVDNPPSFSNQQVNETPHYLEDVKMSIVISETNASHYKFFWNDTGSFVNETEQTYSDGENVSTVKTVNTPHQNICWGYWANDTAGQSVTSSLNCFTVQNTKPSKPTIIYPVNNTVVIDTNITFYSTDYDTDSLTYYIYINDTLNITTQGNVTDFNASDNNYKLQIKSNDGIEDSDLSDIIYFNLDTGVPVITVLNINLTYNETYNLLPLYINFSVSENSNCSVNDSNWNLNYSTPTFFSFSDTNSTPEQFYSIMIECNDTVGNTGYENIYFTLDRTPPFSYSYNPVHGFDDYSYGLLLINKSATDNIALYSFVSNITKLSDGSLLWSYTNTTISNESVNISEFSLELLLDVSAWENTSMRNCDVTCDAHTKKEMKEKDKAKKIKKETKKLTYEFDNDLNIEIESLTGDEDSTDNLDDKKDRHRPKFKYKKKTIGKKFKLLSNKKIFKIESTIFPGWFVIDDRYWVDFDDGKGSQTDVKFENGDWIIDIDNDDSEIIFNSIGPLNCQTKCYDFTFKQPYHPVMTVYNPTPPSYSGVLGETLSFDIEVDDNNTGDIITYRWEVDSVVKSISEDYDFLISPGSIGTIFDVQVTISDNSVFNYTDSESWNVTITSGHLTTYQMNDFSNIVVDGIGTAGVSFVEQIDLIIIVLIVSGIGVALYLGFKKLR